MIGLTIVSLLVVPFVPAGAAPRSHNPPAGGILTDSDGDHVDEALERRLRRSEGTTRHAVVVATDGSLSLARAHRVAGSFSVGRRLEIVGGFSAKLSAGQIRRLASTPGVLRIDHDAVIRATMDAARSDYGVEAARADLGLTGAGITVCILDTGADPDHEQLDSKNIVWQDFVGTAASPVDDHGHGTHVASIAVGDGVGGPNAARFGGVAPAAGLWVGKVLNAQGSGSESGIIDAIDWCVDSPEVDVISMSLGSELPSDGSDVLGIAANNAVASGKIVVAAAGNAGDAPDSMASPGAAADVIAVGAASSWSAAPGAVNHANGIYLAPFSARGGPTFAADPKPDVIAPGVNVRAAAANTGSGYTTLSGTSMAAPFAAGSIALALEAWVGSSPTPAAVQNAVEASAEDYGPVGKDPDWGAGLIDVLALTSQAAGVSGASVFPTHQHLSGTVPDHGEWTHEFELGPDDLGVPIAVSIVLDGSCEDFLGFGCLFGWAPDIDAELVDPTGELLDVSVCAAIESGDPSPGPCAIGRQETLHAMPSVAGTYLIRLFPFGGSPNDGLGGAFDLDLSTGPVGDDTTPPPPPPPPPSIHVGDLDDVSITLSSTRWRARATIRVHDGTHAAASGVLVRGRFGPNGSTLSCTTGATGACTLKRDLKRTRLSIEFVVVGLSKEAHTYLAGSNHDADGESNGTKIVVTRP